MGWVVFIAIVGIIFAAIWKFQSAEERKVAAMSADERAQYQKQHAEYWRNREAAQREEKALRERGPLNPWTICPHCQTKGTVRTRKVDKKKGISGAKATAAVITGGTSVLVTGLSRKEKLTQAHCENCGSDWLF